MDQRAMMDGQAAKALDGPVPDDVGSVPTAEVSNDTTVKIAIAMEATAKAVEEAFATAQAQGVGAMFDAIVEDGVQQGEGAVVVARAKRVMVLALEFLRKGSTNYDQRADIPKLYNLTPSPKP